MLVKLGTPLCAVRQITSWLPQWGKPNRFRFSISRQLLYSVPSTSHPYHYLVTYMVNLDTHATCLLVVLPYDL